MRRVLAVLIVAALSYAAVAVAYPGATLTSTPTTVTVGNLDCATNYEIRVREWRAGAWRDQNTYQKTTAACVTPTPTATPTATPTSTATPSPTPVGACATPTPNVPDGPDPFGGCYPGPSNTGPADEATLTTYTGPCTVTAANVTIDSQAVNCSPLVVGSTASGLVIKNSRVNGGVIQNSGSASFAIQDSIIDNNVSYPACSAPATCPAGKYACGDPNNQTTQCGVGYQNFTITRSEVMHTNRAAYCERHCTITDSYFHGTNLWPDPSDGAHASSARVEQYATLRHNSLSCDFEGPWYGNDLGCSADITGYPDFAPIHDNTIDRNLLLSNNVGTAFCAYGGGTGGKPFSGDPLNATNVVYTDNVFQRGANGKCGEYGPVTDFVAGRPGNVWTGNVFDNGTVVPPA